MQPPPLTTYNLMLIASPKYLEVCNSKLFAFGAEHITLRRARLPGSPLEILKLELTISHDQRMKLEKAFSFMRNQGLLSARFERADQPITSKT